MHYIFLWVRLVNTLTMIALTPQLEIQAADGDQVIEKCLGAS